MYDRYHISDDLERVLETRTKYGSYGNSSPGAVAGALAQEMGWRTYDNDAAEDVLIGIADELEDVIRKPPPEAIENRGEQVIRTVLADLEPEELRQAVIGFGLGHRPIESTVAGIPGALREILASAFTGPINKMLQRWERDTLGPRRRLTPRQRRRLDA